MWASPLPIRARRCGSCRTSLRPTAIPRRCGRVFAWHATSAEQAPLRPFAAAEIAPGPDGWSDAALDAHIRATAITVHHPLGTCRMGAESDEMAVVDGTLRVRGVDALRVVDASVMPDLVGGNINAAVIMIAEKAADLIRGRAPPAPLNV